MVGELFAVWKARVRDQRLEELLHLWAEHHYLARRCRSAVQAWARFAAARRAERAEARFERMAGARVQAACEPLHARIKEVEPC